MLTYCGHEINAQMKFWPHASNDDRRPSARQTNVVGSWFFYPHIKGQLRKQTHQNYSKNHSFSPIKGRRDQRLNYRDANQANQCEVNVSPSFCSCTLFSQFFDLFGFLFCYCFVDRLSLSQVLEEQPFISFILKSILKLI